MTQVTVPESLRFYFESQGNVDAIETLAPKIGRGTDSHDMSWDDLAMP